MTEPDPFVPPTRDGHLAVASNRRLREVFDAVRPWVPIASAFGAGLNLFLALDAADHGHPWWRLAAAAAADAIAVLVLGPWPARQR